MRISDWSSDVCSSDLRIVLFKDHHRQHRGLAIERDHGHLDIAAVDKGFDDRIVVERVNLCDRARQFDAIVRIADAPRSRAVVRLDHPAPRGWAARGVDRRPATNQGPRCGWHAARSEEHTSELQSLMRLSYAVCCLHNKTKRHNNLTISNVRIK